MDIFPIVPKVTRLQKLRRLRRASDGDFPSCLQSYMVMKVTVLLRNFHFFSSKSYKVSEVMKVTQGFCWDIFPLVSKVTWLRKLECFLEIFNFFLPKVTRFQKLRRLRREIVGDFPSCLQSYFKV